MTAAEGSAENRDATGLIRKELKHIEFPGAAWTTFDRYARYSALVRAIRSNLGAGPISVLDVGDSSGYLAAFDPEVRTLCLDIELAPDPLPGARRLLGDGVHLPFPDNAFDGVVSSDTLEHIPPESREPFLRELARVSKDLVVIAAPFDEPGVAGAEELVRRYVLLATGKPQDQLDEHRAYGLPDVASARSVLQAAGLQVAVVPNGNLHDWVAMMLLKHQLAARWALGALHDGYDILYNYVFSARERVPPSYRQVLIGRRGAAPRTGSAKPPARAREAADVPSLLAGFMVANSTEVIRQDIEPRLQRIEELAVEVVRATGRLQFDLTAFQRSVEGSIEELEAGIHRVEAQASDRLRELQGRLARLESRVDETDAKVGRLVQLLRYPLRSARRALARRIRVPDAGA